MALPPFGLLERGFLRYRPSPCLGARGFSRGLIFKQDGTLVASVAQEGLIRDLEG